MRPHEPAFDPDPGALRDVGVLPRATPTRCSPTPEPARDCASAGAGAVDARFVRTTASPVADGAVAVRPSRWCWSPPASSRSCSPASPVAVRRGRSRRRRRTAPSLARRASGAAGAVGDRRLGATRPRCRRGLRPPGAGRGSRDPARRPRHWSDPEVSGRRRGRSGGRCSRRAAEPSAPAAAAPGRPCAAARRDYLRARRGLGRLRDEEVLHVDELGPCPPGGDLRQLVLAPARDRRGGLLGLALRRGPAWRCRSCRNPDGGLDRLGALAEEHLARPATARCRARRVAEPIVTPPPTSTRNGGGRGDRARGGGPARSASAWRRACQPYGGDGRLEVDELGDRLGVHVGPPGGQQRDDLVVGVGAAPPAARHAEDPRPAR